MIYKINHLFTILFDKILYPLRNFNDFWAILILSILSSFVVLFAYKYLSSPKKIKNAKDKIKASIFAIRIYKDYAGVILSSFFKSLFYTLKYFALNLVPIIIIVPILLPVFSQMEVRYGVDSFRVNDEIIVNVKFNKPIDDMKIELKDNEFYKKVMPPVFSYKIREVDWKVKVLKKGVGEIEVSVNGKTYKKRLVVGLKGFALSDKKFRVSNWEHIYYPSETLLEEDSPIEEIYVYYPVKLVKFGINMHWVIWYLVLMLIIVLGLKNKFNIEF